MFSVCAWGVKESVAFGVHRLSDHQNEEKHMSRYSLETIIVILIILWLLGWLAFPVGGNLIHILLVIILVVVVIRLMRGQTAI